MARFYGSLKGSEGITTRLGSSASGMYCSVGGWNSSISVQADVIDDTDLFTVRLTSGLSTAHNSVVIGQFTAKDLIRLSLKQAAKRLKQTSI